MFQFSNSTLTPYRVIKSLCIRKKNTLYYKIIIKLLSHTIKKYCTHYNHKAQKLFLFISKSQVRNINLRFVAFEFTQWLLHSFFHSFKREMLLPFFYVSYLLSHVTIGANSNIFLKICFGFPAFLKMFSLCFSNLLT